MIRAERIVVRNSKFPTAVSAWTVVENGGWISLYPTACQMIGGVLLEIRIRFNILFTIPRPFKSVSARRSGTLVR